MKLYMSPGACSLSPHIVLREANLPFTPVKVNTKTKETEGGGDYRKINAKGYVPALQLDDGQVLTEGPAIVQYLADKAPASGLAPANGTMDRYRLQEWLNFVTSEIHKQFSPLFDPTASDDLKQRQRIKLAGRFDWLNAELADRTYLLGTQFTVADAYLFTVLNWCQWTGIDLANWPVLSEYVRRVAARPKVQEALRAEGMLK
ncbi:MAG: glutathione transferase GstA [Gemmatimonadota bacterium]